MYHLFVCHLAVFRPRVILSLCTNAALTARGIINFSVKATGVTI